MPQPIRFRCEVDDCFEVAVVFIQGRLFCGLHALPRIREAEPEQLKTVELVQADWLRPKVVAWRSREQRAR